jgi:hypothetical protein
VENIAHVMANSQIGEMSPIPISISGTEDLSPEKLQIINQQNL